MNVERARLTGDAHAVARWRKWGPYLADRAWGTVREDYSADGDAWHFFPHDLARSRTYRWGEDGIAGFCDRYEILCWSMAFWNGCDPILKERYFGLIPDEGNHGEDVKENYFYLDALPSHAYQRMLYKYPQRAYPYDEIVAENEKRTTEDPEYELLDTGIFDDGRYFDVEIEIAKEDDDDIVFRVTAHNRGSERATLHLIPQLWFRNTWAWGAERLPEPSISLIALPNGNVGLLADDSGTPPLSGLLVPHRLGPHILELPAGTRTLFTRNETNTERLEPPTPAPPHTKDAFHRAIVHGEEGAVDPSNRGTKACGWIAVEIDGSASHTIRMRLAPADRDRAADLTSSVDATIAARHAEADEFYASIHPPRATDDEKNVQRQAFAGLLWSKQVYLFDVDVWLDGDDPGNPPPAARENGRNSRWRHLNSMRVMSMPDKWEYPWFAAWDLAFHAVTFALIDAHFAKEQLWLMLFEQFQHPNGQLPAYEWEFCDLNPPVHAWAVWRVYNMDRIRSGEADVAFLEKCFHKLLLNFTWWVNKVDREGNNVFEGGFLGLDNITIFNRSDAFPGGATLEQSDATGWMGMFCLVMMRIALELAKTNAVYEGLATKFFEHYVYIGAAMKMKRGGLTLWDEQDHFFYDLLRFPDGTAVPFRVRSLVGLIPLYAIERLEGKWIESFDVFRDNLQWFMTNRREIVESCVTTVESAGDFTHVLAVVDQNQLQHLLARVVDPEEFQSAHGMRSLSRFHKEHPFTLGDNSVGYEPGNAISKLKGGNSNWRGPVWMPTTFLMIESLRKLEKAFGGSVRVTLGGNGDEPPPVVTPMADTRANEGLGAVSQGDARARGMSIPAATAEAPAETISLTGMAEEMANGLIGIFTRDADGYRPLYGPRGTRKAELFARDPHWRDLVVFHEFYDGDTAEGLGASHQTGWTALVANLIDEWR